MALLRRDGGVLVEFRPMSPEEIERTVQFLLRQQAQFAADFEKSSLRTDQLAEGLVKLSAKTDQLAGGLIKLSAKTDQLADGLISLTNTVDRLSRMFERHLLEDHGRQSS